MRFGCCTPLAHGADRLFLSVGVLLLAGLLAGARAHAHGDVHQRIDALTAEIERSPRSAELYLRRGELWETHGEWRKAEVDLKRAARYAPGLVGVGVAHGRIKIQRGCPRAAEKILTRHLNAHPGSAQGWLWRARARVALGEYEQAASDFDRALALDPVADPGVYVERAGALMDAGLPQAAAALRGLEEGLRRLGPVITLELAAIDAEQRLETWDAAIARVDRILASVYRRESWLVRKAEIQERAGRFEAAMTTYEESLKAMAQLPDSIRTLPATRELQARARLRLALLPAPARAAWSRASHTGF